MYCSRHSFRRRFEYRGVIMGASHQLDGETADLP